MQVKAREIEHGGKARRCEGRGKVMQGQARAEARQSKAWRGSRQGIEGNVRDEVSKARRRRGWREG
jgi:hypothetical protein